MDFLSLPFQYVIWHYFVALSDIFNNYKDLNWFLDKFFAPRVIFKNLFYPINFSLIFKEDKSYTLNTSLKLALIFSSFLVRIFLFALYIISKALLFVLVISFYIFWLLLPVFMLMLLKEGIVLLIL